MRACRIWHLSQRDGCLGVFGPAPQPISMSERRLTAAITDVKTYRRLFI